MQVFEWDVLEHPDHDAWLSGMREDGWFRVTGIPGVKTPVGTIEYTFQLVPVGDPAAS